ncbi:MAG: transposase [Verrucomicrobia bacterium]|nr:transposase [Verrucomicrobiota bacterium]
MVSWRSSDDHPGLKRSIAEVLPEVFWQRCYVHDLPAYGQLRVRGIQGSGSLTPPLCPE